MDGAKTLTAALLTLSLIGGTAALRFDASIEPNATFNARNTQVSETIEGLHQANTSITNTGSVGCTVRLKTVYNNSEKAYSQEAALWPGQNTFLKTNELFMEPGRYRGTLKIQYCGQEEKIKAFNLTAKGTNSSDRQINSSTVEVSESRVNVSTEVEKSLLIPERSPPYWKVPDTEVVNGTASISFQAPIFDSDEEIAFRVYNRTSGKITGETTVSLEEPEPGKVQQFISAVQNAVPGLLTASILLNLLLAAALLRRTRDED